MTKLTTTEYLLLTLLALVISFTVLHRYIAEPVRALVNQTASTITEAQP